LLKLGDRLSANVQSEDVQFLTTPKWHHDVVLPHGVGFRPTGNRDVAHSPNFPFAAQKKKQRERQSTHLTQATGKLMSTYEQRLASFKDCTSVVVARYLQWKM
jgi:hypothetical protein